MSTEPELPRSGPAAAKAEALAPATEGNENPKGMYLYQTAGIVERKGAVPWWLWAVAVLLAIWSVYYLIVYWNAPPSVPRPGAPIHATDR